MIKSVLNGGIILLICVLFSCNGKRTSEKSNGIENSEQTKKVIRIKGSETLRPVVEKVIEHYARIHPEIYIEYDGGGSGLGILALRQQETDIALVSRSLTVDELKQIDTVNLFRSRILGYDGLSIVVNLSNPVKKITLQQLQGIYSGQIKNWKEVGGKDLPIVLYSRDISSGTYLFFKEKVLNSFEYSKDDINLVHNKEIVSNILQSPGAVGYVGHADVHPNLRVLSIAVKDSDKYFDPNYVTIKSGEYPLSRSLYYIIPRNAPSHLLQLDSFLMSPTIKQIISEVGFISE